MQRQPGKRRSKTTRLVLGSLALVACLLAAAVDGQVATKRYKPRLIVLSGHTEDVQYIVFSPDGKFILTSDAKKAKLWDKTSGIELRELPPTSSAQFTKDSKYILDGVYLTDIFTGVTKTVAPWKHPEGATVYSAISDDGKRMAMLAGEEYMMMLLPSQEVIASGTSKCVSIDAQVRYLARCSTENGATSIAVVDTFTKSSVSVGPLERPPAQIALSDDLSRIVAGDQSGFSVWDRATGKLINKLKLTMTDADLNNVILSPNADAILYSKARGTNLNDREFFIWRVDKPSAVLLEGNTNAIPNSEIRPSMAYGPDGKHFAISFFLPTSDSGRTGREVVRVFDASTQKEIKAIQTIVGPRPTVPVILAFEPDSTRLAMQRGNGVYLLNYESGTLAMYYAGVANDPKVISLSRRGATIAEYTGIEQAQWRNSYQNWQGATMIWDLANADPEPRQAVGAITFSADTARFKAKYIEHHDSYLNTHWFAKDISDLDGSEVTEATMVQRLKVAVQNARDGSHFEQAERLIQNRTKNEPNLLVLDGRVSPDGTRMAMMVVDRKEIESDTAIAVIELWDINSGKRLWSVKPAKDFSGIHFSEDGRSIVTGTFQLDAENGKQSDLPASAGSIETLAAVTRMTIGGRQVDVAPEDNCVEIRDAQTHELIAQLYWLNVSDWAVVTPSGLFDGSEAAQKAMGFLVVDPEIGYVPFTLDQLKATHYVPGLLHKLFFDQKELPKVGDFSISLPPAIDSNLAESSKSLEIDARPRGGGIGRIEVRVNGVEVTSDARSADPKATHFSVDISSRTHFGDNMVETIAWNSEGNVRSLPDRINLLVKEPNGAKGFPSAKPQDEKKNGDVNFYAIVSGVADYQGSGIDLRFAARDAENMATSISLAARKYFCAEELAAKKPCDRVHVRLLSTEENKDAQFTGLADTKDLKRLEPSKQGFVDAFKEVAQKAKPEDVVFVYMSGHGTAITSEQAVKESAFADMYLYPTRDASTLDREVMSNPTERDAKAVSSLELAKWLSEIKADKRVMVLDTCAAGAVQKELTQARAVDALQTRSIDRLRERSGFYILMGAAADAQSFEANEFRQGLLTYSLIEGMTNDKGLREGKFVDIENWFNYAQDEVNRLSEHIGGVQKPSFFKSTSASTFDIGRVDADELRLIPLARPVPLIIKPELRAMDLTDPEDLSGKLEVKLREQSYVSTKGQASSINYISASSAVKGISPRGLYTVSGDDITANVSLIRDNKVIGQLTVTAKRDDIADRLVEAILNSLSGK
ncbi:MAG TPA: caspase family protein [Pyrinomonadaceae bacterium]|nr:caspase family protein [Pyrinomonadaceae bacterium]